MLYVLRQYSLPLLLALVLYAAAVLALYRGWQPETVIDRVIRPNIVRSELIVLQPKAKPAPRAKPAPAPKPEPVAAARPEPRPEPKPVPDADAARRKAEELARQEAQQRELELQEAERQRRLDQLASEAFVQALEQESQSLAESDEADAAASYRQGIYERIVANWSRPPSARNNMQARVLVELIPTGDVVSVTIVESSANRAFDQSVEAAVRKARRFDVPDDTDLFETYFRRFSVLFKPEDLLR